MVTPPQPERRRQQLLLALVGAACLLPFANKAVHIDDTMFLWAAQHIQSHPLDFYGFDVNWYGHVTSMAETNKNPPGVSYYIALATLLFGWSEVGLHLALFLPALALLLGTHALASSLCKHPLAAALTTLAMPAVLVSSTTLMSDVPALALWVWALAAWVRGLEARSPRWLLAAGLAAGLAFWTEYFAASLLPLMAVYGALRERRLGAWVLYLAVPLALIGAYQLAVGLLYDQNLFGDLFGYAARTRAKAGLSLLDRGLTGLFFLGGSCLAPLFLAPVLARRHPVWLGGAGLGAIALGAAFLANVGPVSALPEVESPAVRASLAVQAALFTAVALGTLGLALAALRSLRDPGAVLLGLWVLGVFVFEAFLNWTVNARAVLPAAPAVAILFWRHLERAGHAEWLRPPARLVPGIAAALAVALAVTLGDYTFAGSARRAAAELSERYAPEAKTLWFQGAWGFQYYMERAGGRRITIGRTRLVPGDIVLVPTNNTNLILFPRETVTLIEQHRYPVGPWVGILSKPLGAGFYASLWGPLPFAFGVPPPELYYVIGVVRPWAIRPAASLPPGFRASPYNRKKMQVPATAYAATPVIHAFVNPISEAR